MNVIDKENIIDVGDKVLCVYHETVVFGTVREIEYGGRITQYFVNLDKPLTLFGVERDLIYIECFPTAWKDQAFFGNNFLINKDHLLDSGVQKFLLNFEYFRNLIV